jgi:LacI family transcriptional regulator
VSIIGFDDLPFCEIVSPRLSTIRVSKQEMGQVAVRRVMEIAQDPEGSKLKIQLCTQFVERDSVRKITEKE